MTGASRGIGYALAQAFADAILVNNAATDPYFGPIVDIDPGRGDKTVRVNQSAASPMVGSPG